MDDVTTIRRIWSDPCVLVASVGTNLFALVLPLAILHIYDRVIPNAATETLALFAAALVVVAGLDLALRIARGRLVSLAGTRFEVAAHARALDGLLRPGATPPDEADTLFDRFASIGRMRRHYGSEMAMALLDLPFVCVFLAAMALISPVLGASAMALLLASLGVITILRRRMNRLHRERLDRDRRRYSFLSETLAGIEAIKALGIEPLMQRRYESLMGRSAMLTRDLGGLVSVTQGATGTIALVAPVVMASVASVLVIRGDMTMGGLAAGVLLTGRIIQPTLRVEALIAGERDIGPAVADVEGLVRRGAPPPARAALQAIDEIALDGVVIPEGGIAAGPRAGIDLRLRRGEAVLVEGGADGERGALLSVLGGHLSPQAGRVLINGRSADAFDAADRAARTAYLSAGQTLLSGTLMENLTAFEPGRHGATALALSREVGLDAFIARHPQGYAMPVSASTAGVLPTSVRDTALIVAGLARRPDLILFDRANIDLDHEADAALLRLLRRLKPRVILVMVTRRPSFARLADRTCRLHGTGSATSCDARGGET